MLKIIFAVFSLLVSSAWADEAHKVTSVQKDGTLIVDDAIAIHLSGIVLDVRDDIALRNLDTLLLNQSAVLVNSNPPKDRHGRLVTDVMINGQSAARMLVGRGIARVYPFAGDVFLIASLLPLEREARENRRGVWQSGDDKILDAAQPDSIGPEGSFQIVEGKVTSIEKRKGAIYINFGDNYWTDFTLFAAPKDQASFRKSGKDLMQLQGKTVQVRGWIYNRNGPAMDLITPQQVEIVR